MPKRHHCRDFQAPDCLLRLGAVRSASPSSPERWSTSTSGHPGASLASPPSPSWTRCNATRPQGPADRRHQLDQRPADAARFLAGHHVAFPSPSGPNESCAKQFGVGAMPSSFFVDRSGRIRASIPASARAKDQWSGRASRNCWGAGCPRDAGCPDPAAAAALCSCAHVEPWQRGTLAEPHMALDPHPRRSRSSRMSAPPARRHLEG